MNIYELELKYDLKEEQLLILFDILFQYHNYNVKEYEVNNLSDVITVLKYTNDRDNVPDLDTLYKMSIDLCDKGLLLSIITKKGRSFIAAKIIRGNNFYKELDERVSK